jgi:hypothetical protein
MLSLVCGIGTRNRLSECIPQNFSLLVNGTDASLSGGDVCSVMKLHEKVKKC